MVCLEDDYYALTVDSGFFGGFGTEALLGPLDDPGLFIVGGLYMFEDEVRFAGLDLALPSALSASIDF